MFDASIRSKIAKLPNTNGVAAQSGEDGKNLVADGVEEGVPDIETHTAHLLNLLNELRSFADQAYDEADLAKLEETSNAKFAELESRIRDQETQLKNREIQSQHLASERDFLVSRLKEAELAAEQAEAKTHQFTERMEAELTNLRLQLAKREESLAARDSALSRFEGDLRTHIQPSTSIAARKLDWQNREREVKQKQEVIHAAAAGETEIDKLIERLFGR